MATPSLPVDPFAGPSLRQRTTMTSTPANPGQGFIQNGPQFFNAAPMSTRTAMTGLAGFGAPTGRVVAGVRPESQAQFNARRYASGRSPVIPSHLDPLSAGAQFLFAR